MVDLQIRASASRRHGLGHVMRCLAIAEAGRRRGLAVEFLTSTAGAELVRARGLPATIVPSSGWSGEVRRAAHLVVDGYDLEPADISGAAARAATVGVVDDLGSGSWPATALLNPSMLPRHTRYELPPGTFTLLGPRHALIRDEFRGQDVRRRTTRGEGVHVLVTFGGSDPAGLGPAVASLVTSIPWVTEVTLLIGPAATPVDVPGVSVVRAPDAVVPVLAGADIAVTAAGSTVWELLHLGVPCVPVAVAENQRAVIRTFRELGLGTPITGELNHQELLAALARTVEVADRLSARGLALVDGGGARRFLDLLVGEPEHRATPGDLRVRSVQPGDVDLLLRWANDPVVRERSTYPEPIPRSSHIEWFRDSLRSPRRAIWVGMLGDEPVGMVRFDLHDDGSAKVSIALDAGHRGRGRGYELLARAMLVAPEADELIAQVRPDNEPSLRLFQRAGFRRAGSTTIDGVALVILRRPR